jgi:hypothetical protein
MLLAALTEQTGHDGNKLKEHANVREKRVQPREKEVRRERATAAVRWFQPESEAAAAASSSLIYSVSLSCSTTFLVLFLFVGFGVDDG